MSDIRVFIISASGSIMPEIEGILKKFESYCRKLGGVFGGNIIDGRNSWPRGPAIWLGCWDAKRMPDPKQFVNLMKEFRDALKEEGGGVADIRFTTKESKKYTDPPLRGFLGITVFPTGVDNLTLGKDIGFPQIWEKEMNEAVKSLKSVVEAYQKDRNWNVNWIEDRNHLRLELNFRRGWDISNWKRLEEVWEESDWSRLEEILKKAREILEWGIKAEHVAKSTCSDGLIPYL